MVKRYAVDFVGLPMASLASRDKGGRGQQDNGCPTREQLSAFASVSSDDEEHGRRLIVVGLKGSPLSSNGLYGTPQSE